MHTAASLHSLFATAAQQLVVCSLCAEPVTVCCSTHRWPLLADWVMTATTLYVSVCPWQALLLPCLAITLHCGPAVSAPSSAVQLSALPRYSKQHMPLQHPARTHTVLLLCPLRLRRCVQLHRPRCGTACGALAVLFYAATSVLSKPWRCACAAASNCTAHDGSGTACGALAAAHAATSVLFKPCPLLSMRCVRLRATRGVLASIAPKLWLVALRLTEAMSLSLSSSLGAAGRAQ